MSFVVVIPARYASERLPGKPLQKIGGVPMIVRVADAAARSAASEVIVATDDERVATAVREGGFEAVMTREDHPSGSDRVMEAVALRGFADDVVVLNVQGDEPLIPPAVIDQLGGAMVDDPGAGCATLCEPLTRSADLLNPNVVKVVCDSAQEALYFSRAPIPWDRDRFPESTAGRLAEGSWWRHIGLYAFRVRVLRHFVGLPSGKLETLERLEQLRLLEHGIPIRVLSACEPVPAGVDTAEDLERVRRLFA